MLQIASLFTLSLIGLVRAQGIKNNAVQMNQIENAEIMLNDGDYYVQNVATGHYLQFERPDDTTDLTTRPKKATINIEYGSAYGRSGKKTGTYVGSVFSGMSKCMSAQFDDGLGYDYAAVSYACAVNGGQGTKTLEKAKQFWKLYPCGPGASNSGFGFQLASKRGKQKKQTTSFSKVPPKTNRATTRKSTPKKSTSRRPTTRKSTNKKSSSKKSSSKKSSSKKSSRKSTKVVKCTKSGKWLARHPAYLTENGGRPECKSAYNAYRRANKRSEIGFDHTSRFARLHRRAVPEVQPSALEKRGALMGTYCIIAVDHLSDMATRAVGDSNLNTFGGYVSMELNVWNANDQSQQWIITSA